MTDKSIRVTLREQKNKSGRTSLYLDFYPAIYDEKKKKDTRRKFMDLYVFEKPANKLEREHNKYTMIKAKQIENEYQLESLSKKHPVCTWKMNGLGSHITSPSYIKEQFSK